MNAQKTHTSRRSGRQLLAGFCLAWLAAPAVHAYGIRTVIVSPVAGNPTASGAALLTAIAGITTASATNPYLLKIEPGVYDVGATHFQMKEWVDVEGSGIDVTTIQGFGDDVFIGVVEGASNTEIRHLTIKAIAEEEAYPYAIGLSLFEVVGQRVYRVRFLADGGESQWGIRAVDSSLDAREIEVDFDDAALISYGISMRGSQAGDSSLLDSRIAIRNTQFAHGLHFGEVTSFAVAERVSIEVEGSSYAAGIWYRQFYSAALVGQVEYRDFDIRAESAGAGIAGQGAFGAYVNDDADQVFVESRIHTFAEAGDSIGIRCSGFSFCPTRVDNSEILTDTPGGADRAVDGSADLRIGTSLIEGSTAGSIGICAGVYDLAYTLYTAPACP
jgi:hypothetical protein